MSSKITARLFIRNFRTDINASSINTNKPSTPLLPASVFWDFENCSLSRGMKFIFLIADVPISNFTSAIKSLLLKHGLFAKEIHAIGHFSQLSSQNLKGLTEMGVNMTDVPSKKEVSSSRSC